MANETKNQNTGGNDEDDDLRARFAALEEKSRPEPGQDELPPVPEVTVTRPDTQTARGTTPPADGGTRLPGMGVLGTGGVAGSNLRSTGKALTIGTGLVGSIVAGVLLGWLADKYLLHSTTTQWGLIVGFLLGVTSGFINLVRVANELNRDDARK